MNDTDEARCGCGQGSQGSASLRQCAECEKTLCYDCAEASDMDGTGDYCAPCFEERDR